MNTPPKIAAPVERFHDNKDAYKAGKEKTITLQYNPVMKSIEPLQCR
jgi:hypothetical protein